MCEIATDLSANQPPPLEPYNLFKSDPVAELRRDLFDRAGEEAGARRLVGRMATCCAASLLVQHGDSAVADTYVASRPRGDWGSELGTLNPAGAELRGIAERAVPQR